MWSASGRRVLQELLLPRAVRGFSVTPAQNTVVVERWWQVPLSKVGRPPRLHPRRHRVYKMVEDTTHSPSAKMELILTQTVPKLGGRGDVVLVKKSVGRNKLLAEGLAVYPSPENKRIFAEELRLLQEGRPEDRIQTRTGQMTVEFLRHSKLNIIKMESAEYQLTKEVVIRQFSKKLGVMMSPEALNFPFESVKDVGEYWCEVTVNGLDTVRVPISLLPYEDQSAAYQRSKKAAATLQTPAAEENIAAAQTVAAAVPEVAAAAPEVAAAVPEVAVENIVAVPEASAERAAPEVAAAIPEAAAETAVPEVAAAAPEVAAAVPEVAAAVPEAAAETAVPEVAAAAPEVAAAVPEVAAAVPEAAAETAVPEVAAAAPEVAAAVPEVAAAVPEAAAETAVPEVAAETAAPEAAAETAAPEVAAVAPEVAAAVPEAAAETAAAETAAAVPEAAAEKTAATPDVAAETTASESATETTSIPEASAAAPEAVHIKEAVSEAAGRLTDKETAAPAESQRDSTAPPSESPEKK